MVPELPPPQHAGIAQCCALVGGGLQGLAGIPAEGGHAGAHGGGRPDAWGGVPQRVRRGVPRRVGRGRARRFRQPSRKPCRGSSRSLAHTLRGSLSGGYAQSGTGAGTAAEGGKGHARGQRDPGWGGCGGAGGFPVWRARDSGRGLRLRRKRFAGRKPAGWGPCGRALAGGISIGRTPTGGRRCGGDAPARRTASLRGAGGGAFGFASGPASAPASGPVPGGTSGRVPGGASGAPAGGAAFPLVGLLPGRASSGRASAAGGVPVLLVGVSRAAGAGGRMARVAAALGAPGASRTLRRAGGHPAHAGRGHALEAGQDPQDGEMAGRDGLE